MPRSQVAQVLGELGREPQREGVLAGTLDDLALGPALAGQSGALLPGRQADLADQPTRPGEAHLDLNVVRPWPGELVAVRQGMRAASMFRWRPSTRGWRMIRGMESAKSAG